MLSADGNNEVLCRKHGEYFAELSVSSLSLLFHSL